MLHVNKSVNALSSFFWAQTVPLPSKVNCCIWMLTQEHQENTKRTPGHREETSHSESWRVQVGQKRMAVRWVNIATDETRLCGESKTLLILLHGLLHEHPWTCPWDLFQGWWACVPCARPIRSEQDPVRPPGGTSMKSYLIYLMLPSMYHCRGKKPFDGPLFGDEAPKTRKRTIRNFTRPAGDLKEFLKVLLPNKSGWSTGHWIKDPSPGL